RGYRCKCRLEPQQENVYDLSDDALDRSFETIARFVQLLPKDGHIQPPVSEKLASYALYKQATLGPCTTPRPSFLHPILRMMWNAWNQLGDLPQREAKCKYIVNFIKRTELNYEQYQNELPEWMCDTIYDEAKMYAKERMGQFGVSYLRTPEGLKSISIVAKEVGFDF
ncbi:hypothetical protein PMAYCL1PPCAC_05687, partial [Pristionchus mayeri]